MRTYETYLFDLDGTIYLGEEALPGALDLIEWIAAEQIPFRFLTNNPTQHPWQYADKLRRLGIACEPEQVITSVSATIHWLKSNAPTARIFPIGEDPLRQALEEAGVPVSDSPEEIDIVLTSFDRTFTYEKLQTAFDALWYHRRAVLMSTNPDRYCPYPGGRGEPDAAAITAAIEACTGMEVERTFGKPGPILAEMALASTGTGVRPRDCLMVGDRLGTDIAMGRRAGMDTALVLTGDSTREEALAAPCPPTWVLERVGELLPRGPLM